MAQPELKIVDEMRAGYIFNKGAVGGISDDMGRLIGELMEWAVKEDLKIAGPPFGVYYSSPEEMARGEIQFEVGLPFVGEAREGDHVRIKTFPAQNVLSVIHKGPYNQIAPAYAALMEYATKNGFEVVGPPMELWLTNPMEVAESEFLTEIRFPVAKR
ncbi:MAG: GyrI-like domain-containing protein [Halobacteriota archaeon]